jgi:pimeloyl-ACP methyl ester carboxylesterase/DNA-binding winged helix-turn-helix (wHTH) protein
MTNAVSAANQIYFPPYNLDLAAERLTRNSEPIDLAPKAFGVLRHLAERAGRLVTKEELLKAVWPSVYVTPDVLKVTIAEIRRALGDSPKEPRFIETAHRRGYRFVPVPEAEPQSPGAFEPPRTHYTRSGEVNLAYQTLGDGPIDLVFVMGWVSHLDYFWTEPSFARFLRRLAKFSRLILFDKRGTGLSDRVPVGELPTLEQRMDDVRAVMDAAGSRRAVLCGVSEGGAMSALFAATYPERTAALITIGAYSRRIRDESYPWGPTPAEREAFLREIQENWGGPVGLETRAPSKVADAQFRDWWAAYLRTSASPAAAVALTRMNSEADVRHVLPAIRVPTLVMHRAHDRCLLVEEGRYMAERIPTARFVELPGEDHLPFVGDQDAILDQVEKFVAGMDHGEAAESVLATILSISCEPLSPMVHRFHDHVQRELGWFRGQACVHGERTVVAHFDGPARAIRCACAIRHYASRLAIPVKAGVHMGECHVSSGSVNGPAVETADRIRELAADGEVLVSSTTRDLVAGSGIRFQPAGTLTPTSEPGFLQLLTVEPNACGPIPGPAVSRG